MPFYLLLDIGMSMTMASRKPPLALSQMKPGRIPLQVFIKTKRGVMMSEKKIMVVKVFFAIFGLAVVWFAWGGFRSWTPWG